MDNIFTLRYMQYSDIAQVVAIDKEAFAAPWSAKSYAYEIDESTYSYMLVLEHGMVHPIQGWRRFIPNFNGGRQSIELQQEIIGYGGLWMISDEAHISTLATRSDWRGKHYGELMLATMIHRSITLEAVSIVLEVRVGNLAAQRLYRKYGFTIAAVKPRYYQDNREDAYDMRLNLMDPDIVNHFYNQYHEVKIHLDYIDQFTDTPHPAQGFS